jgi:non-homologous end joining protein Ku
MTWQRVRTGGVYLRLSLVTCPVVLYPASSQNEKIHFHQINRKTGNRMHQQMLDERTGKVVDKDDKGHGYEHLEAAPAYNEPNSR